MKCFQKHWFRSNSEVLLPGIADKLFGCLCAQRAALGILPIHHKNTEELHLQNLSTFSAGLKLLPRSVSEIMCSDGTLQSQQGELGRMLFSYACCFAFSHYRSLLARICYVILPAGPMTCAATQLQKQSQFACRFLARCDIDAITNYTNIQDNGVYSRAPPVVAEWYAPQRSYNAAELRRVYERIICSNERTEVCNVVVNMCHMCM